MRFYDFFYFPSELGTCTFWCAGVGAAAIGAENEILFDGARRLRRPISRPGADQTFGGSIHAALSCESGQIHAIQSILLSIVWARTGSGMEVPMHLCLWRGRNVDIQVTSTALTRPHRIKSNSPLPCSGVMLRLRLQHREGRFIKTWSFQSSAVRARRTPIH
jgi:hypothetical protein